MIRRNITPDYKLLYRHQQPMMRSSGPAGLRPANEPGNSGANPHAGLVADPMNALASAEWTFLQEQIDAGRALLRNGILEPQTAGDEQNLRAAREAELPFGSPIQPLPVMQPTLPDPLRGPAPFNPLETVPGGMPNPLKPM